MKISIPGALSPCHGSDRAGARRGGIVLGTLLAVVLAGCAGGPGGLPRGDFKSLQKTGPGPLYEIGPGDSLQIFVWENPELSVTIPVRPDGRINTPLVEDLAAAGRTPTELARDLEEALSRYIRNPVVTVIVSGFVGSPTRRSASWARRLNRRRCSTASA